MPGRYVRSTNMGVGSELQELGRFLDDCERRTDAVESLDVAEVTGVGDQRLTANLELRLSVGSAADGGTGLCDPRVGPDGTVRFALEPTRDLCLSTDHDVDVEPTDASVDADGSVTVTLAATVPAEASAPGAGSLEQATTDGTAGDSTADGELDASEAFDGATRVDAGDEFDADSTAASGGSADAGGSSGVDDPSTTSHSAGAGDSAVADGASEADARLDAPAASSRRDVPPFKDPELLADVYESCDTFAEMAERLEMDVTGETVRRYMIEHDIHEPTTYQTDSDDAGGQPVVLSDGIGLPEDVTVEALIETVKTSNTIHQVKQDIDVEREDALEMLKELNLLDLVVGRLATEGERETTREDVVECLREASAVQ